MAPTIEVVNSHFDRTDKIVLAELVLSQIRIAYDSEDNIVGIHEDDNPRFAERQTNDVDVTASRDKPACDVSQLVWMFCGEFAAWMEEDLKPVAICTTDDFFEFVGFHGVIPPMSWQIK